MRDCIASGLNWDCITLPNEVTDVQISILSCIYGKRKFTGIFTTTMSFVNIKNKKEANTSRKNEMNKLNCISILFPIIIVYTQDEESPKKAS